MDINTAHYSSKPYLRSIRTCPNVAVISANNGLLDHFGGQELIVYITFPTHDGPCKFAVLASGFHVLVDITTKSSFLFFTGGVISFVGRL